MKPIVTKTQILQIHDWMLGLGLTDKQLKLYALIYGYSQDGMSRMRGTSASIAKWLGCTRRHVCTLLRELEDLGLIAHEVVRHMDETFTLFWVLNPDSPDHKKATGRRRWFGRELEFTTDREPEFTTGGELEFTTDRDSNIYSQDSNINKNTRGKNTRVKRDDAQGSMVLFNPPTIQEVADYARAQGFADPEGFADYYVTYQTEAGWMTGKGSKRHPIDNWKLNVIAWGRYRKTEIFTQQPERERETRQLTQEEIAKYFPGL